MSITNTKLTFKLGLAIALVSTLFTYSTYRLVESIMFMFNH